MPERLQAVNRSFLTFRKAAPIGRFFRGYAVVVDACTAGLVFILLSSTLPPSIEASAAIPRWGTVPERRGG